MTSHLSIALTAIGGALTGMGAVMQFVLDQWGKKEEQKLTDIRDFIERLDDGIGDFKKMDKTRGLITKRVSILEKQSKSFRKLLN
jgi:hypothetical protein